MNQQRTCALCGYTGKLIGGMAGEYPLCHRDHTNGATCYEKVTRAHTFGEPFSVVINYLKKEREQ